MPFITEDLRVAMAVTACSHCLCGAKVGAPEGGSGSGVIASYSEYAQSAHSLYDAMTPRGRAGGVATKLPLTKLRARQATARFLLFAKIVTERLPLPLDNNIDDKTPITIIGYGGSL